jgi:hypothetical protein
MPKLAPRVRKRKRRACRAITFPADILRIEQIRDRLDELDAVTARFGLRRPRGRR